ncbi:hypothetical protein SASPL_101100 [Salvia splendens]|uniref:Uncharacterized protein n=1 Tax=Salvia splendens TaxID=180675 RepID=A0A8X8YNM8_SALSN|nr:uncharacterized protein LOC121742045 [Salvia splendens]KAG6436215.1 hypothetical protein SASPL_101100 [Salvia splendens]
MAFDCNNNHRKPLLFSDLFKNHQNDKDQHGAASASASSSSSNQFLSSWDSSSSGFSTPLRSDFGSSEGDDADFIADLTRQMAECMLDDEETAAADTVSEASSYDNLDAINNESYSSSVRIDGSSQASMKVYELKNQPQRATRGRRLRRSESTQQKTEQQYKQYRGREWGGGPVINGYSGSVMQAVFLGGSGPRIGSSGTGVFLPRDPTEPKTKSGCSMVLMPTRVLQVLEKHFSKIQEDSNAPPPHSGGSPKEEGESRISDGLEMQLPQEWTY